MAIIEGHFIWSVQASTTTTATCELISSIWIISFFFRIKQECNILHFAVSYLWLKIILDEFLLCRK